jgi:ribosomal protein S27AE
MSDDPKVATARHEGEIAEEDAGAGNGPGEATPSALANNSPDGEHPATDDVGTSLGTLAITRATCRLELRIDDLATEPAIHKKHVKHRRTETCGDHCPVCQEREACPACRLGRQLKACQRSAATAANVALRILYRVDADTCDRIWLAEQRPPAKADWGAWYNSEALDVIDGALRTLGPGFDSDSVVRQGQKGTRYVYLYPVVRRIAPELPGGMASALVRMVESRWKTDRWDVLVRQSKSCPSWTQDTFPIPLRAQDCKLKLGADGYRFEFSLAAGRTERWSVPIYCPSDDERLSALLRQLVASNVKVGEAKLLPDRLRPGRWYVRIAYTRQVERAIGTGPVVAVRPGMVALISVVASSGELWQYFGDDLEHHLRMIQARRRSIQGSSKVSGRIGHGRPRTLAPTDALTDAHARWVDSWIQTRARRLAEWIRALHPRIVVMPEFSGVRDGQPERLKVRAQRWVWERIQEWPAYRFQQALISCLEEYGVRTLPEGPAHLKARNGRLAEDGIDARHSCPECGSTEVELSLSRHKRRLRCVACGHVEQLDLALTRSILRRACERLGDALPTGPARKVTTQPKMPAGRGGPTEAHYPGAHGRKSKNSTARKPNGRSLKTLQNSQTAHDTLRTAG